MKKIKLYYAHRDDLSTHYYRTRQEAEAAKEHILQCLDDYSSCSWNICEEKFTQEELQSKDIKIKNGSWLIRQSRKEKEKKLWERR